MGVAFQDYYETLGVNRTATEKEIKTAYRKLARKWHPDLHTGKAKIEAEEKIKLINEAYEVLKDPEKRNKYDYLGANWQAGQDFRPPPNAKGFQYYSDFSGTSGDGFSDFFEMLFGGRAGGVGQTSHASRRSVPIPGRDMETELELTLEEIYQGGEKQLQLTNKELCSLCGGTGVNNNSFCFQCGGSGEITGSKTITVKIPSGRRQGNRIRLKGQGGSGLSGGPPGDLYLKIKLLPHAYFKVQNNDLETEITLKPEESVLGCSVSAPTLDGPVIIKVPAQTHSGKRLRLRGKGLPAKEGRGDEYVRIRIDIPEHLSTEAKALYQKLAELKNGVNKEPGNEV